MTGIIKYEVTNIYLCTSYVFNIDYDTSFNKREI